jgi:hypothetical protein
MNERLFVVYKQILSTPGQSGASGHKSGRSRPPRRPGFLRERRNDPGRRGGTFSWK